MTCIVANLESMASDRFVTYGPSYTGATKIWVAKGSVWGAAGDVGQCLAFKAWTLGKGKRPQVESEEEEGSRIEVLELSPKGLFLWINDSVGDAIREHFYAIGSGGGYAIGALSMGATLEQAVEVAAKWDSNTRMPFDMIALASIKRKRG
jgi:hypothetical protein